jgi:hypothetical protein
MMILATAAGVVNAGISFYLHALVYLELYQQTILA